MARFTSQHTGAQIDEAIASVRGLGSDNVVKESVLNAALTNKADLVGGKVRSDQLPSFVDDVVEFDTIEDLPEIGESGKIYVTLDNDNSWRWTGSTYQKVSQPLDEMPQSVAEAGTSETLYAATARRIRQAITAWWNTVTAIENKTIGLVSAAAGVFTTLRATGQIRSDSSFVAAAGTPVYLGNTEDASVAELSSPSPAVLKIKTAYMDTLTVSALTGNKSHTPFAVDTTAGANYHLFQQAGVLKAITGSEASIFGTNPNNYGTYLYEGGAEYFISTNGGKVFRATPSGLWGYGDFSLGQAGARVAYLPNDSLTYEGRAYANYGMSAHPELVGLSGFNGVGLFAAGGLRSEVTNKGLKVYGSTSVIGGGSKIQRTIYGICSCELSPNEKVNGFKLKTTIPYGDNTFFTIRLHGYDYRAATPIDLTVSLYNYSFGVIQAGASSAGGWAPVIRAANEGGALVLHFGLQVSDGYYAHFDVDATFFAMPADDARTEGWAFVDEPLTGTGQVTIPCVNRMADLHLTNSAFIAGKLNIGTTLVPTASVNLLVPNGLQSYSTSGGGFAALAKAGGGADWYNYTGAVGAEAYTFAASLSDVAFSKFGGHANQNPNPGAETPYAGAAYEWSAYNAGYQGYLWRAQAMQPTGAYVNYADLVFSNPITGEVLRVKPSGIAVTGAITTNGLKEDAAGNMGLGVAPSAWGAGYKAIDIGTSGSLASNTGVSTFILNNCYYNGANWVYRTSTVGVGAQIFGGNPSGTGGFSWSQAPSGNAGDPISFTQVMTLDAAGHLGLGVTPSAWDMGERALQFPSYGAVAFSGQHGRFMANAVISGGVFRYIANGSATLYAHNAGQHQWLSAPAGNAGDPISFTQAMTLDAAGVLALAALPANDFPNDAAAAADGIPIGGLYHTGGTVKVRLT